MQRNKPGTEERIIRLQGGGQEPETASKQTRNKKQIPSHTERQPTMGMENNTDSITDMADTNNWESRMHNLETNTRNQK